MRSDGRSLKVVTMLLAVVGSYLVHLGVVEGAFGGGGTLEYNVTSPEDDGFYDTFRAQWNLLLSNLTNSPSTDNFILRITCDCCTIYFKSNDSVSSVLLPVTLENTKKITIEGNGAKLDGSMLQEQLPLFSALPPPSASPSSQNLVYQSLTFQHFGGGAIIASTNGPAIEIYQSTFYSNARAVEFNLLSDVTCIVQSCTFSNNYNSPALKINGAGIMQIQACTFANNGDIAVYANSVYSLQVDHSIMVQNGGTSDLFCASTSVNSDCSVYGTVNCPSYYSFSDQVIGSKVVVDNIADNGGDTWTCLPIDLTIVANVAQPNSYPDQRGCTCGKGPNEAGSIYSCCNASVVCPTHSPSMTPSLSQSASPSSSSSLSAAQVSVTPSITSSVSVSPAASSPPTPTSSSSASKHPLPLNSNSRQPTKTKTKTPAPTPTSTETPTGVETPHVVINNPKNSEVQSSEVTIESTSVTTPITIKAGGAVFANINVPPYTFPSGCTLVIRQSNSSADRVSMDDCEAGAIPTSGSPRFDITIGPGCDGIDSKNLNNSIEISILAETKSPNEACLGFVEGGTVWNCLQTQHSRKSGGTLYTAKVDHFTSFGIIFSYNSFDSCSEQLTLLYIAVALIGGLIAFSIFIGTLFLYNDAFNGFIHGRFGVSMKQADQILRRSMMSQAPQP